MTIDELNAIDLDAAVSALAGVAEHSPWVTEETLAARPFADVTALQEAYRRTIVDAPYERRYLLIDRHPELAGDRARFGGLTAESSREQAGAGLDRLSPQDAAEFDQLNADYRAKFGYPFVICVRDHTPQTILDAFRARIEGEPMDEVDVATLEVAKIVAYRVAEIVSG